MSCCEIQLCGSTLIPMLHSSFVLSYWKLCCRDISKRTKGQSLRYMNLVMRNPVFALCEQQRHRSACASVQSDQHLYCSPHRQYNTSSFYTQNFKSLASFSCGALWFDSYLVADLEDRISCDEAHISLYYDHINAFDAFA